MFQAGRGNEAAVKFDRVLKLDPKNPEAWNGRSWVAFEFRPANMMKWSNTFQRFWC